MSKHTFKWQGGHGFLDANVSAYAMKGNDIKRNGVKLDPRRTFLPGDTIVFDDEDLAVMLKGNGNWREVPNEPVSRPRKVKISKKVNEDKEDKESE